MPSTAPECSDDPPPVPVTRVAAVVVATIVAFVATYLFGDRLPPSAAVVLFVPAVLLAVPTRSLGLHQIAHWTGVGAGGLVRDGWDVVVELVSRAILLGAIGWFGDRWMRARIEIRRTAEHDALTGVLNTRGFRRRLEEEIARVDRGSSSFSLVVLDCDRFKAFNDEHGHVAGDRFLVRLAEALVASTRRYDVVARLGGDEFAVLLPTTGEEGAQTAVDRIRGVLADLVAESGGEAGISVGLASFATAPDSADAALTIADGRMYEDKRLRRSS